MKNYTKLLLSLLLVLTLLVAVPSMTAFAEGEEDATPNVMSSPYFTVQGDLFTTTVYIAEGANIVDFDMHLTYDTDKLTLVRAEEHDDMKGSVVFTTKNAGEIDINYTRTTQNVTEYMPLVDLTFEVSEYIPAGTYDTLTVDGTKAFVAHTLTDEGLVSVPLVCEFSPLVIYDTGDVDMNGSADIGDVTVLRRYLAGYVELTDFQLILADTYYDGRVDIGDAICLQRHLANQEVLFGNRETVRFFGLTGEEIYLKSVVRGEALSVLPHVPELSGYENGRWSATPEFYTPIDLSEVTEETKVYAVYDEVLSVQMEYYRDFLSQYVDEFGGYIYSNKTLPTEIPFAEDTSYYADVIWSVSNANVFDREGTFNKPTYDTGMTLTATIYSRHNGASFEKASAIKFALVAKGVYSTPTKAEIVDYLRSITGGTVSSDGSSSVTGGFITKDLNLTRKVSNTEVNSDTPYEVHIDWQIESDGTLYPISRITRGTTEVTGVNLVATVTFNGMPLGGDGKIYFYDVTLSAISEAEIRYYVIDSIASNVSISLSTGDKLWDNDERYGSTVKWLSGNNDIMTILGNEVTVSDNAVNGASCPVKVQVAYPTDEGIRTFELEYVVTANTSNTLLSPGVNISESLYYALLLELDVRVLTTDTLKNTKFVYLDLSKYSEEFTDGAGNIHPALTDITGITHCENIRVLNISNLKITRGLSEISTLGYLEAFIAKNCGIETLSVGGTSVLESTLGLKLLDLSYNELTTLDGILSEKNVYNKLKEIYLNNNKLTDVSLLDRAPLLGTLALSENELDSSDISVIGSLSSLTYLSLAGNNITDLAPLKKLTSLTELRLQKNEISDIEPLSGLKKLTALYLGDNKITTVTKLSTLTSLEVLYLNNNSIKAIDALGSMTSLRVLNISSNSISSAYALSGLAPTDSYSGLTELYAENNNILSFSFVKNLSGLKKLLLSGNAATGDEAIDMSEYLSGLTSLEVLTLAGKKLYDLSFLENEEGYKPIVRLDISGCELSPYYIIEENEGVVSEYVDNLKLLGGLRSTLKYLDISNNPLAEALGDYSFTEVGPSTLEILRNLNRLELFYADNVKIGGLAYSLMSMMSELRYVSFENAEIDNISWLGISSYYRFIDLANNPIGYFDYSFVTGSIETLEYLYLDTTYELSRIDKDGVSDFSDNVLLAVSFEGFNIDSVDSISDMDRVEYMNLRNTGILDLLGEEDGGFYYSSIGRFTSLRELYLGGNDGLFTKSNLDHLYECYSESDTKVYLYSDTSLVGFDRERESAYVNQLALMTQGFLRDGGNVVDYRNSGDNALLNATSFRGFDITWREEDDYFEVTDNLLKVTNIALPEDEYDLSLFGDIELYGEECTLTATVHFYKDKYVISYVLDSEDNSYSNREAVNAPSNIDEGKETLSYSVDGADVVIRDPTRGEYDIFLGWYLDGDYTTPFVNDLKDNPRNITLYAKWDVATYYDSINDTPNGTVDLPGGRVIIDWSRENGSNILNQTDSQFVGLITDYDINVTSKTDTVVFIGNPELKYGNVNISLVDFEDGQALTLKLINFNFNTGYASAIKSNNNAALELTVENQGSSSIGTNRNSGSIINLPSANVTLKGDGKLTLKAGNGADAQAAGGSGADGGVAVYAGHLTFELDGELLIHGGNGGNGKAGADGIDGGPSGTWYKYDDVYNWAGTHIQILYRYNDASDGTDGQDGGAGGNGGMPIFCDSVVSVQGAVKLYYGDGGNGQDGGAGGKGGNGNKFKYETTGVSFIKAYDPGNGGDGGDGGKGGDAGHSRTAIYTFNFDNVEIIVGTNGTAGTGGAGGGKGLGGSGGKATASFQEHTASDASDGDPGEKGADGNP